MRCFDPPQARVRSIFRMYVSSTAGGAATMSFTDYACDHMHAMVHMCEGMVLHCTTV